MFSQKQRISKIKYMVMVYQLGGYHLIFGGMNRGDVNPATRSHRRELGSKNQATRTGRREPGSENRTIGIGQQASATGIGQQASDNRHWTAGIGQQAPGGQSKELLGRL